MTTRTPSEWAMMWMLRKPMAASALIMPVKDAVIQKITKADANLIGKRMHPASAGGLFLVKLCAPCCKAAQLEAAA